MDLHVPKEPRPVKDWMKMVEANKGKTPGIKWDALNVWYGNQLPKYLWEEWKSNLKPHGFTWQIFLKLLKHRTDKVILWNKDILKWEELAEEFISLIEGPFGRELTKK